jgi:toxin ParE1/3/4
VRRLIDAADVLERHPQLGAIVAELEQPEVRELVRGNYRLIYRVRKSRISILAVYHAARLLDEDSLGE